MCAMHITEFSTGWQGDPGLQLAAEDVEGLLRRLAALSATACKVAVLHTAATGGALLALPGAETTLLARPAPATTAGCGVPDQPASAPAKEAALAQRLLGTTHYCWMLAQSLVQRAASSEHCKRCEAAIPAACPVWRQVSCVGAVIVMA